MRLNRPKFVNYEVGNFPTEKEFDTVELKYDGWWAQLLIEGDKWEIWSRTGMLKKEGKLKAKNIHRTLLHGEFIFGTEWAKDRPHLYEKVAIFGAEMIFGVDVCSTSATNEDVKSMIEDVVFELDEDIIKRCFFVQQFPTEQAPAVWKEYVEGQKFEGLVFKNSQSVWGDPFGRMKQVASMDYVCLGFNESDSETYQGWGVACILGGLYVEGKLIQVCKVSGLLDEYRSEFYQNPDKYIGRVFEARGKKVSKKGALRHPDFVRWRDDKKPEDCVW